MTGAGNMSHNEQISINVIFIFGRKMTELHPFEVDQVSKVRSEKNQVEVF